MSNSGDKSSTPRRNPQSPLPSSSGGRNGGRSSSFRGGRGRNAPTPVPRTYFGEGGRVNVGGGSGSGGGSSERKRRWDGDVGAGPSMPPQQRVVAVRPQQPPPPQEPLPPVQYGMGDFPCALCDMTFDSDKSLAGHMRMHPDRPWRGMHPPPTFSRAEFADVADLLNPEHEDEDDEDYDYDDNNNNDGRGGSRGNHFNLPDLNKTPSPPTSSSS